MAKFHRVYEMDNEEYYSFRCPACNCSHVIRVTANSEGWQWNGDLNRPTVTPSIAVTSEIFCHSYIEDGFIRFVEDSTHEMREQTIELPEWIDA